MLYALMVMFAVQGTPISVANNKKYQELFGEDVSKILSIYEHKHDHKHGVDGSVKEK